MACRFSNKIELSENWIVEWLHLYECSEGIGSLIFVRNENNERIYTTTLCQATLLTVDPKIAEMSCMEERLKWRTPQTRDSVSDKQFQ